MTEYLYHGSHVSTIEKLNAASLLHGTSDTKVVYLTDSLPYSLFYIWDAEHNIKPGKHVTARIKDGIVYYEEQFPDQLAEFYKGVSGYVYSVEKDASFHRVNERESMWYSENDACVRQVKTVSDVYSKIIKYESQGLVKIIHFSDVSAEKINDLYNHIAGSIVKRGLLNNPHSKDAQFYKTYFKQVWNMAMKIK